MNNESNIQDARAVVADLNFSALLNLSATLGLRFGTTMKDWRPTVRSRGTVPGIPGALTLLATDGVAAYFLRDDGGVLYGHVGHFDGKVAPLFSASTGTPVAQKVKRARKPKSKKTLERERRAKLIDDL